MYFMLERFMKLHETVDSVLGDIDLDKLRLAESDLHTIRDIMKCLEPFEVCS